MTPMTGPQGRGSMRRGAIGDHGVFQDKPSNQVHSVPPDLHPSWDEYGESTPTTSTVARGSIVKIEIDETAKKVGPLVRHFREMGVFTEEMYKKLLLRMCKTCGVPDYVKNAPQFEWNTKATTYERDRGVYLCETDKKRICLKDLVDLRGFLCLWYLYLKSRNNNFNGIKEDRAIFSKTCPENRYASEIMKLSEPQRVLRLEERRFLEEVEL